MTVEEARRDDEVILGTFSLNDRLDRVLFDDGACKCFVSPMFCARSVLPWSPLGYMLDIEIMVRNSVQVWEKFDGCFIVLSGHTFPMTLILIGINLFDVIIGMHWMSTNQAEILCADKRICIPFFWRGSYLCSWGEVLGSIHIIFMMKAQK